MFFCEYFMGIPNSHIPYCRKFLIFFFLRRPFWGTLFLPALHYEIHEIYDTNSHNISFTPKHCKSLSPFHHLQTFSCDHIFFFEDDEKTEHIHESTISLRCRWNIQRFWECHMVPATWLTCQKLAAKKPTSSAFDCHKGELLFRQNYLK